MNRIQRSSVAEGQHDELRLLAPFERCDGCPGRAVVSVGLSSGGVLVLCGAHARRLDHALLAQGATFFGDYTWEAAQPAEAAPLPVEPAPPVHHGHPAGTGAAFRASQQSVEIPARELPQPPSWWQRLIHRYFKA